MGKIEGIWNVERTELLKTLNAEKLFSFSQIAMAINQQTGSRFSRNACIGKAARIGLVHGPLPRGPDWGVRKPRGPDRTRKRQRTPVNSIGRKWFYKMDREPEQTQAPYSFLGIALDDLERNQCRYPRGDGPFLFCGQRKMKGSSYCPHCHGFCYRQPTARLKFGAA